MSRFGVRRACGVGFLAVALAAVAGRGIVIAAGEEWPAYGADARRSFRTANRLNLPLVERWRYVPAQPPKPAWPEPGKELHRIDFDFCFQPVIGGGLAFFGSSGDHTLRAVDLSTGRLRWRFVAGGPIRFAPHLHGGRVYLACDDGVVTCLDAADGSPVWSRRLALRDDLVVGNEQVTSRWPSRSGVTIADGVLYVVAGMWPSEGVFVHALDPADGRDLWVNDTCGQHFMRYAHAADAVGGVSPQGYPAVAERVLLVPCGRGRPAGFDIATGELLYVNVEVAERWAHGGSRVSVAGDLFFNASSRGTTSHVRASTAEAEPMPFEGTAAFAVATGATAKQYFLPAREAGNTNADYRVLAALDRVFAVDSRGFLRAASMDDPGNRNVRRKLWEQPFDGERIYEMAWAGEHLILGDRGRVLVHDAETGVRLAELAVVGQARGLAVADGHLLVATDRGELVAFGPAVSAAPPAAAPTIHDERLRQAERPPARWPAGYEPLGELLAGPAGQPSPGFAVVAGMEDTEVSEAIAERAGRRVVQLVSDPARIGSLRDRLADEARPAAGWPIHILPAAQASGLPDWFANLAVARLEDGPDLADRLNSFYRLVRPHGGLFMCVGIASGHAALGQAGIPAAEVSAIPGGLLVRRGPPANEPPIAPPFRMAWFGGPGPNRMSDRHLTDAPQPQAVAGRVFVLGENHLLAIDAFSGVELWQLPIHQAVLREGKSFYRRMTMTAGEDVVRLHFEHGPQLDVDARTGRPIRFYGLPLAERVMALPDAGRTLELTPDDPQRVADRGVAARVELRPQAEWLEIALELTNPVVSVFDQFDLHFDFREAGKRFGLYGPGAFHLTVYPGIRYDRTAGVWLLHMENPRIQRLLPRVEKDAVFEREAFALPGAGPEHPAFSVTGGVADNGARLAVVRIPWSEVGRLAGRATVRDFAFAATARTCDNRLDPGNPRPFEWLRLHADKDSMRINNGWPTFDRDASGDDGRAEPIRDALLADLESLPALVPAEPWTANTAHAEAPEYRVHPLTGAPSRRTIRPSYGCGTPVSLGAVSYFRSATLGYYDFADDSGVHAIGGIRPGCGGNLGLLPVSGRLVYTERSSGCGCSYNFQSSFGLIPTRAAGNEYWALFYEEPAEDRIRMASLNLSAPGDRRDPDGDLWLGMPRPTTSRNPALVVPATWDILEGSGFGPYRFSTDRRPIQGTDRPWVYGSGIRGLRRLTLDLGGAISVTAPRATGPIAVDGRLDEESWAGEQPEGQVALPMGRLLYNHSHWDRGRLAGSNASWAVARYDDERLYLAFFDASRLNRRGKPEQWKGQAQDRDDPRLSADPRYEAFFSDREGRRVVRLAVSCTGASYDALNQDTAAGPEDPAWNGSWEHAALVNEEGFAVEMAVPWSTLAEAGIDTETVQINLFARGQPPFRDHYLRELGRFGHERAELFVPLHRDAPALPPERRFSVVLHFAEIDDVSPGERVFDILLQGRSVAEQVDIVRLAGGRDRALALRFDDVVATDRIELELVPRVGEPGPRTAPILAGVQCRESGLGGR